MEVGQARQRPVAALTLLSSPATRLACEYIAALLGSPAPLVPHGWHGTDASDAATAPVRLAAAVACTHTEPAAQA